MFFYYCLYLFARSFGIAFRFFGLLFGCFGVLILLDQFSLFDTSYFVQKFFFFLAGIFLIFDLIYQIQKQKFLFSKKNFYRFAENHFSLDFKLYNLIDRYHSFSLARKKSAVAEINQILYKFDSKIFLSVIKKKFFLFLILLGFSLSTWLIMPQVYQSVLGNISLFFSEKKYYYQLTYEKQVNVNQDTVINYHGNYQSVAITIYGTNVLGESTNITYRGDHRLQTILNQVDKDIVFVVTLRQNKLVRKKQHTIKVVTNPRLIATELHLLDEKNKTHFYRNIQYIQIKNLKKINFQAIYDQEQKINEVQLLVDSHYHLTPKKITANTFTVEIDLANLPFDFNGNIHWQVKNQYDLWSEKKHLYFDFPKKKKPIVTIQYPPKKHDLLKITNLGLLAKIFSEFPLTKVTLFLKTPLKNYQQDINIHLPRLSHVQGNNVFIEDEINLQKIEFLPAMTIDYYLVGKNENNLLGYSATNQIYYVTHSEQLIQNIAKQQQLHSPLLGKKSQNSTLVKHIDKMEVAIEKKNWQQVNFHKQTIKDNITKIEVQLQEIKNKLEKKSQQAEEEIYYRKLQKIVNEINRLDQSLIHFLKQNLSAKNHTLNKDQLRSNQFLEKAKQLTKEITYLEKQIEYFKKLEKIKIYYQIANNVYENTFALKLEFLKKNIQLTEDNFQQLLTQSYAFQKKSIEIDYRYLQQEYLSNYLDLLADFPDYQHLINNLNFFFKQKIVFLNKKKINFTSLENFLRHQEKIINDLSALLNAFVSDPLAMIIAELTRQIDSFTVFNHWQENYQKNMLFFKSEKILNHPSKQNDLLVYINENKSQSKYFRNQLYVKAIGHITNIIVFLQHYDDNIKWFERVQRYYDPANTKNNLRVSLKELKKIFPTKKHKELTSIYYSHQHDMKPFWKTSTGKNNQLLYQLILLKDKLQQENKNFQNQQNHSRTQQQNLQDLLQQFQKMSAADRDNQQYSRSLEKEILKKINDYQQSLTQQQTISQKTTKNKQQKKNDTEKYLAEIQKDLVELQSALQDKATSRKIKKIIKKFANNLAKTKQVRYAIEQKNNKRLSQKHQSEKVQKHHSKFKKTPIDYDFNNKKKELEEIIEYPSEYQEKINFFLQKK